jgi:hypothetical protein
MRRVARPRWDDDASTAKPPAPQLCGFVAPVLLLAFGCSRSICFSLLFSFPSDFRRHGTGVLPVTRAAGGDGTHGQCLPDLPQSLAPRLLHVRPLCRSALPAVKLRKVKKREKLVLRTSIRSTYVYSSLLALCAGRTADDETSDDGVATPRDPLFHP